MIKYLNRERSKELIELGISPDKASLVSWKNTQTWDRKPVYDKEHIDVKPFRPAVMGFEDFDCQDIFTIGDLIDLLPKKIKKRNVEYILNISPFYGHWSVSYDYYGNSSIFVKNDELVNALFETIQYLNSNFKNEIIHE